MSVFWKTAAGILTAIILWINLNQSNKDTSVLMTLAVCAMAMMAAASFLQPVVSFVDKLQDIGKLDAGLVSTVLKVVGVGIITEIAALICKDAGNESMGKALQFVSAGVVLWISIPLFEKLLALLDKILGGV
ncbi:MAG: stage III sporulation AC/AD family protein [Oscillospiraceae bacterium]|nr:stage III sporulation AC/AD family protein [Oscillospiraceae bacterium]